MAHEKQDVELAMNLPDAPPMKQSVRSFKKKYAKMKVKFELGIRENESLIREELRIEDLSKRIQEQNDQLLEVLLEFNDSLHVSPTLRYDLAMPDDTSFLPPGENSGIASLINDETLARSALKEAKARLANGSFPTNAYRQVEDSIKRNKAFLPAQQYSTLAKLSHTPGSSLEQEKLPTGVERTLGYFTPEHETEYYLALDAKLGDEAAAIQLARIPDPPTFAEREKEASARNPASVANWLRRNQPQSMQDHEAASDKSASRPSNSRSKRAPVQKKEEEVDEDGMDVEPTPKNKRKRDEDTGYRPKGGNNRSKKKKDDATPPSNRNVKKT
ncbi:hypothetical protein N7495_009790 [Penicillium taxi]|uniref:uncharacterized protein n=1 Tax=Penicillium taxi TaxID=168475 RepID=UPI0025453279|nr:uncharacterized protein N7495_009790 [Penicillium taxi]KAJ5885280.1 hypothetical protein N7495_009790 [Penicillium taxi]